MKNLNSAESLYIQLLQENISRMNQNSMQCKTWCIALIAGVLAVVATTQNENLIFIGIAITLGAYVLDCSYLRLEKNFRRFEKRFIDALKDDSPNEQLINTFLFDFEKDKLTAKRTKWITRKPYEGAPVVKANRLHWRDAIFSWSTSLIYLVILGILVGLYYILRTPAVQCCSCCSQ